MMGESKRRVVIVCALACALLPLVGTASSSARSSDPAASGAQATRPNVLLIVSDDQAWSTFSRDLMPSVYGQLVDQGTLFTRAYVNTSLCCPSRAQILTGLYEHHTGVDANQVGLDRPTFPMALHDAGYRTMLAGKYLNSWPCSPRPEFDRWACVGGSETAHVSLLNPSINVDGTWAKYAGYQPDVLANFAKEFIAGTPANQPFFVMYTPRSPHLPADDPRYGEMPVSPPRGPTFNENTMTPGTPQYARRQALTSAEIKQSDADYVSMAHSTRSLDDAVGSMLDALGSRANNTIVIYLSDNGFLYGEHRRFGKNDPWEESVNVPMVIRYPALLPVEQPFVSRALVQNVDLAPTILQLAGIQWGADGTSLLPILSKQRSTVRSAALLENCRGESQGSPTCFGLTFDGGKSDTPGFQGIITSRYKYLEYDDGSTQLIDLKTDPLEQRNMAGERRGSSLGKRLASRLRGMLRSRARTTIATGPGPYLDDRIAAFKYFSPSRFASYRCRLAKEGTDAAWKACPGQFYAVGNLADGTYVFQVAGTDGYGHFDRTPASRTFTVSSDPDIDVGLTSHPKVDQSGSSASFTYASSFENAGFQCRLDAWDVDGTWSPCDPAGFAVDGLNDGIYRFEVRAQAPGGGAVSGSGTGWVFRIDNAGPAVTFASKPPADTRRQDASFRFVPLERTTGRFHCTIDQRPVKCANGIVHVRALGAGRHSLAVSATDLAGRVGVSTYHWTVDRGAPEVRFVWGPGRRTSRSTALFRLHSSVSPGMFSCQLDRLPVMPCFDAPVFRSLSKGDHVLQVWSYDVAGNRSLSARYAWRVT